MFPLHNHSCRAENTSGADDRPDIMRVGHLVEHNQNATVFIILKADNIVDIGFL